MDKRLLSIMVKFALSRYLRELETQIDFEGFDRLLSSRIDCCKFLLDQ